MSACVHFCVHPASATPAFGSSKHDHGVLAVVLVMPEADNRDSAGKRRVEPISLHADAFWQDLGRPVEGTPMPAEAPAGAVCVHIPWPHSEESSALEDSCTDTPVKPNWSRMTAAEWRGESRPRRAADIARDYLDLLERIGPLPVPYPREGT